MQLNFKQGECSVTNVFYIGHFVIQNQRQCIFYGFILITVSKINIFLYISIYVWINEGISMTIYSLLITEVIITTTFIICSNIPLLVEIVLFLVSRLRLRLQGLSNSSESQELSFLGKLWKLRDTLKCPCTTKICA